MANRNFPQSRIWGFHMMPIRVGLNIKIGASGAVSSFAGPGVAAVTRLAVGTYRIQLQDNYNSLLHMDASLQSPVTGSNVNDGSFSAGTVYSITAVGTTNWAAAGLPAGLTPAVGMTFLAANVGGSGSGTAKAIGNSGIGAVELISSNPNAMLNNQPFIANAGGFVDIQCLGPTSSSVTTSIPTDPANGSSLRISFWLNNSSVQ